MKAFIVDINVVELEIVFIESPAVTHTFQDMIPSSGGRGHERGDNHPPHLDKVALFDELLLHDIREEHFDLDGPCRAVALWNVGLHSLGAGKLRQRDLVLQLYAVVHQINLCLVNPIDDDLELLCHVFLGCDDELGHLLSAEAADVCHCDWHVLVCVRVLEKEELRLRKHLFLLGGTALFLLLFGHLGFCLCCLKCCVSAFQRFLSIQSLVPFLRL